MSKELEIVKRWRVQIHWNKDFGWKEELSAVESALKDYEKQKQLVQTLKDKIYVKEMKYTKQEKALEIIKEKRVDVQLLKDSKNLNDYNWCVHTKDRALTQEEFDLLRKALEI